MNRQVLGSLLVALAIVAITIVVVTAKLGPNAGERDDGGGTAMDPEVVAQLLGRRDNRGPLAELTPREVEVITLMAEGRSNTGIGMELGISASAIEKHVKQVFMKLDLPPSDSDHRRVLAVLKFLGG